MYKLLFKLVTKLAGILNRIHVKLSNKVNSKLSINNLDLYFTIQPYDIVINKKDIKILENTFSKGRGKSSLGNIYGSDGNYIIGVVAGYSGILNSNSPEKVRVLFFNPKNFEAPTIKVVPTNEVAVLASPFELSVNMAKLLDLQESLVDLLNKEGGAAKDDEDIYH